MLRQAREAKSLAIADVAHCTRIPARVIAALEDDDYGMFSSPTYARSFLNQYAEFVGIDASVWLDYFEPAAFTGVDDVMTVLEAPETMRKASRASSATVTETHNHSHGAGATVLLILVTGALAYGGWKVWPHLDQKFGSLEAAGNSPSNPVDPMTSPPESASTAAGKEMASIPATTPGSTDQDIAPPRAIIVQE